MTKELLGEFIAQQRKLQGMTQKDLAARLHITDKAVSKWERGLSYPDVTLLEPLAEVFGLGVEELVACKEKEEEETVTVLMDISKDSLRRQKLRSDSRLAGVLVLLVLTALLVLHITTIVRETRECTIFLTEQTGEGNYIYVEEEGHLLKLKCAPEVDFDEIAADNMVYRIVCRWDRRTHEGNASVCEKTDIAVLGTKMGQIGSAYILDTGFVREGFDPDAPKDALFGYKSVYCELKNCYPNPYGTGYLYTYVYYSYDRIEGEIVEKRLVEVEDCLGTRLKDFDGDSETELLVYTRWQEKPYLLYDWVNDAPEEIWLDEVPAEWQRIA